MGIINKEIKQYDLVIHSLLDRTKSRTKTKVRNFDRIFLSVLIFKFSYVGESYIIVIIIIIITIIIIINNNIIIIIKTLAGLFSFVIMLRHSLVYQISQRKKKKKKNTHRKKQKIRKKFFVGTIRVKFECHLSDFKLSYLLSDMSINYFCWWWDYRYFTITGECVKTFIYK